MKDHLIFDTTDATTIADTDSVGAFVRSGNNGKLITHHTITANTYEALDVYAALADGSGNAITSTGGALDVNIKGDSIVVKVDLNGIYDGSTNLLPDNVGIIGSSRASPGLANQTLQFTGAGVGSDAVASANIVAQDVNAFGMVYNGTTWDRLKGTSGAANVNIQNSSIAVTQSTSPWVVSGTVAATQSGSWSVSQSGTWTVGLSEDHNYGPVGATTLRTAAQIGNATGAADFGSGSASAQTLRVVLASGTIVNDAALANTAIANAAKTLAVAGTAEATVTTALSNRKYLWVYNNDNTKAYIGSSSVTASNGFPISPGSYMELRAGAAISPYFVGQTGKTPEIRTLELS